MSVLGEELQVLEILCSGLIKSWGWRDMMMIIIIQVDYNSGGWLPVKGRVINLINPPKTKTTLGGICAAQTGGCVKHPICQTCKLVAKSKSEQGIKFCWLRHMWSWGSQIFLAFPPKNMRNGCQNLIQCPVKAIQDLEGPSPSTWQGFFQGARGLPDHQSQFWSEVWRWWGRLTGGWRGFLIVLEN